MYHPRSLYSSRPTQPYHLQADLIWCDGTFKHSSFKKGDMKRLGHLRERKNIQGMRQKCIQFKTLNLLHIKAFVHCKLITNSLLILLSYPYSPLKTYQIKILLELNFILHFLQPYLEMWDVIFSIMPKLQAKPSDFLAPLLPLPAVLL